MSVMKLADANPRTPKIISIASNAMVTRQEQYCPDRKMRSGQRGTYRMETLVEGVAMRRDWLKSSDVGTLET